MRTIVIERLRAARREQAGFTLIELLVAMVLSMIVIGAAFSLYGTAVSGQTRTGSRAEQLQQQRTGLERMTRELRQATVVNSASASVLDFNTYVRVSGATTSTLRRVVYTCNVTTTKSCTRAEGPVGGAVTGAVALVSDLQSATVFDTTTTPGYVALTLQVDVAGVNNPIKLTDGVDLRNAS